MVALALGTGGSSAYSEDLERVLERLGRLAELFEDQALSYACEEKIQWDHYDYGVGRGRFSYVYARNESGEIEDYRTWRKGGRKKGVPREVTPDEYGVPAYLRSASLWVFAFKESRRSRHVYRRVGEDRVLGRRALGIRFEPIPPYVEKVNDWFGTAWIDAETSQLLRVVAHGVEDHDKLATLESHLADELPRPRKIGTTEVRTHYTIQRIITEFGVEKNGLRLPSKVRIEQDRYRVAERGGLYSTKKYKLLRVEQTYTNYQFFNVWTTVEIRAFLDGS
jgi:hypothetical protein